MTYWLSWLFSTRVRQRGSDSRRRIQVIRLMSKLLAIKVEVPKHGIAMFSPQIRL